MNRGTYLLTFITLVGSGTGCQAIVGAECRAGLELENGRCLEPSSEQVRSDAGSPADDAADLGVSGDRGTVGDDVGDPTGDAHTGPDGGSEDVASPDSAGSPFDAWTLEDGGLLTRDAGGSPVLDRFDAGPACGLGRSSCGEVCSDLSADPDHCGDCDTACVSGEMCVDGRCDLVCLAPRIVCADACVDPRTNDQHCGGCGIDCGDDICLDGVCSAPLVGHVIVVGHDFSEPEPMLSTMFGNACQIRLENPLRVALHGGAATSTSVNQVGIAMASSLALVGRGWTQVILDDTSMTQDLLQVDVLLLTPQPGRSAAELRALGETWAIAFRQFMERGGVIVALESESAEAMAHVLEGAGLGRFGTRETIPADTLLWLVAPADSVARDVPLRFRASVPLMGYRSGAAVVSASGVGVVIHDTHLPRMP